jgi:hypothetical protein
VNAGLVCPICAAIHFGSRPIIAANVAHVRLSECGVISGSGGSPLAARFEFARSTARENAIAESVRIAARAVRGAEEVIGGSKRQPTCAAVHGMLEQLVAQVEGDLDLAHACLGLCIGELEAAADEIDLVAADLNLDRRFPGAAGVLASTYTVDNGAHPHNATYYLAKREVGGPVGEVLRDANLGEATG